MSVVICDGWRKEQVLVGSERNKMIPRSLIPPFQISEEEFVLN